MQYWDEAQLKQGGFRVKIMMLLNIVSIQMCLKGRPLHHVVFLASALLFLRDARTGWSYTVNR